MVRFLALFYVAIMLTIPSFFFFFFNDTATTEIYTLSLHDALPIWREAGLRAGDRRALRRHHRAHERPDRKSTRLNSSHSQISYAVFCLKKKKKNKKHHILKAECRYVEVKSI